MGRKGKEKGNEQESTLEKINYGPKLRVTNAQRSQFNSLFM